MLQGLAEEDNTTTTMYSGREGHVIVEESDKFVASLSPLSMKTLRESLWKYRVMSVLLRLEMQFRGLENGHRA